MFDSDHSIEEGLDWKRYKGPAEYLIHQFEEEESELLPKVKDADVDANVWAPKYIEVVSY